MLRLSLILIAALWVGFFAWGTPTEPTAQPEQTASGATARTGAVTIYAVPTILDTARSPMPQTARATPAPVLTIQASATVPKDPIDADPTVDLPLFTVIGTRVNLRAGPSTATDVVMSLSRGSVTEALAPEADGWINIRDLNTGLSGFMASQFLELL